MKPWKLIVGALVVCTAALALLAYWMYPRPQPAAVQIVALDKICTPDDAPVARAQLFVLPDESGPRRLQGLKVIFHEPRLPMPGPNKPREIESLSDDQGRASIDWPVAQAAFSEFFASHVGDREYAVPDRGRVFVWPKDASLVIVDADGALIGDRLSTQAAVDLRRAAKSGSRVVYLTMAGGAAHEFRAACSWIAKHQASLPIGPVLGRLHFPDADSPAAARQGAIDALKARFTGPRRIVLTPADWLGPIPGD
jgi:hypothetical protein